MNTAAQLIKQLTERHLTVTTAESCTGGLVSGLITAQPGASAVLEGALVAYSPRIKQSLLGIAPEIIERAGVVSSECALAMAEGARRLFSADCALALTGYAGPGGGDAENPVGTVWIAAIAPNSTSSEIADAALSEVGTNLTPRPLTHAVRRICIDGDRQTVRLKAAEAALSLLLSLLIPSSRESKDCSHK